LHLLYIVYCVNRAITESNNHCWIINNSYRILFWIRNVQ